MKINILKKVTAALAPALFVLLIDRLSKTMVAHQGSDIIFGWMHIHLMQNQGVMLGLFADLPAHVRIVLFSTIGGFLLCLFFLIQYIIAPQVHLFRMGLSLVIGGILGNVLDRILYGAVIDFLALRIGSWDAPVFNVADLLQWVGYAVTLGAIWKEGGLLWPDQNQRGKVWVLPSFQRRFCATLMSVGLFVDLMAGLFSYMFLKASLERTFVPRAQEQYLWPFLISFCLITVVSLVLLWILGRHLSLRIAGPIYAFRRYLNELVERGAGASQGPLKPFKTRTNDELKELEPLARLIEEALKQKY